MKQFLGSTALFLFVLAGNFSQNACAQQDPGSLLGTILNEAVRQGAPFSENDAYYGDDPRAPNDYYNDRYYDARRRKRLTCESKGERHKYCRTNTQGRIRIERQLSDAPCRRYETWGADGDGSGVWVRDGCRATFIVEPRRLESRDREPRRGGRVRTITCKSKGFDYNYCPTGGRGGQVRLVRQLSDAPCREYYSWGVDGDGGGVWVNQGCSAEFAVRRR